MDETCATSSVEYKPLFILFSGSGSRLQVPGASLQRGSDPEGDERPGKEKRPQDPGLTAAHFSPTAFLILLFKAEHFLLIIVELSHMIH